MPIALGSILAVVFLVIILNFIMLFLRLKRDRIRRPSKDVMDEKKAAEWREKEIKRRLDREQEEAAERVELRNKTLALYEEVRVRGNLRDQKAAENLDKTDGSESTDDQ